MQSQGDQPDPELPLDVPGDDVANVHGDVPHL